VFGGEVFLDRVLTFQKPIHGGVAMLVDIHGPLAAAETPKGGVGSGLG
jgi:hypothetical protein